MRFLTLLLFKLLFFALQVEEILLILQPYSYPACAETDNDGMQLGNLTNSTNERRQYQQINTTQVFVGKILHILLHVVMIRYIAGDEKGSREGAAKNYLFHL